MSIPVRNTVSRWTTASLDDLAGRRYLITGGNSGVGLEAARHLRRAGADVLIAARNPSKGRDAVASVSREPGDGAVELVQLDLASLDSVRAAADDVRGRVGDGLDAVINNAGLMQTPEQRTEDGFELQLGVNHLGHVLLDNLLLDLVAARGGRIVPVSSIVHLRAGAFPFDDPMLERAYSPSRSYNRSKLANLLYGFELARRLEAAGSDVTCVCCHPGYSNTNLQSTGPTGLLNLVYKVLNPLVAQSPVDGAVPEVLAAAGTEAVNGAYYGPTGIGDMRGPVGDSTVASNARDPEAARRLWTWTNELLGITWPFDDPAGS